MNIVLLLLAAIVTAINVKATLVLTHSTYYGTQQKLLQLALIWVLPVMGALWVWSLASGTRSERATANLIDHRGYDDGHIRFEHAVSEDGGADAGGGD